MLASTEATISCVVGGLTKELEAVTWQKPSSGGAITHDTGGYQIAAGSYDSSTNSQTTILTVPAGENTVDAVFTCVITSDEHATTLEKTDVNSNVFSE